MRMPINSNLFMKFVEMHRLAPVVLPKQIKLVSLDDYDEEAIKKYRNSQELLETPVFSVIQLIRTRREVAVNH